MPVVPNLEGLLLTPLLPPEELEKERHGDGENIDGWCRGVETVASIVVRVGVRVRVSGGSGGLRNTRIT